MSIGDLSLYRPVFSQFSVAAISVDCYLSHSSSDLNQRWRLQKILPLPRPPPNTHTHTVSTETSALSTGHYIEAPREGGGLGGEGMEENERR